MDVFYISLYPIQIFSVWIAIVGTLAGSVNDWILRIASDTFSGTLLNRLNSHGIGIHWIAIAFTCIFYNLKNIITPLELLEDISSLTESQQLEILNSLTESLSQQGLV